MNFIPASPSRIRKASFASHMKQRYGIDLYQKKVIVNGRLENYIKRGGWKTFDEFMNAVSLWKNFFLQCSGIFLSCSSE